MKCLFFPFLGLHVLKIIICTKKDIAKLQSEKNHVAVRFSFFRLPLVCNEHQGCCLVTSRTFLFLPMRQSKQRLSQLTSRMLFFLCHWMFNEHRFAQHYGGIKHLRIIPPSLPPHFHHVALGFSYAKLSRT